jgi:hypothetical protein
MSNQLTRRHALKLMSGAMLAAAPALKLTADASAGIGWCRADPHISVGGRETNIYVERDASMPNITTGPIELTITVPAGSAPRVLSSDNGFGYGYDVTFVEASNLNDGAIKIQCRVPAPDNSMLVQLTSVPVDPDYKPQSKRSTTNATFSMNTHI